jgi:hypothetical protein
VFVWLRRHGASVFLNSRSGVEAGLRGLARRPLDGYVIIFAQRKA